VSSLPSGWSSQTIEAEDHRHTFVLSAAKPVAMTLRKGVLGDLLATLAEGESVEFVHQRTNQLLGQPDRSAAYEFSVVARSRLPNHEDLALRVGTTLKVANAIWSFHPERPTLNLPRESTHAWQVQFSAIPALPRPLHGTEAKFDPQNNPEHFELPCPLALPAWALSSILDEDLGLPDSVRMVIRVFPMKLENLMALQLHRLLQRVQSGALALYDPKSPLTAFSANKQLCEPVCDLIGAWLRDPAGYAVDMLIEASGQIPDIAIRRLSRDFAGEVPVTVKALSSPERCNAKLSGFAASLHKSQPLPGIFPDLRLLSALGIPRLFDKPIGLPSAASGVAIGETVCGAGSTPVHLPDADRTSHLAVFGSSGSGKSTFLLQLIAQDMAALDGRGIGLIDPHGTLYRDVLDLVPNSRRNDVVCVDVEDPDYVASINPLEGTKLNPQKSSFVANEVISLIDVLFEGHDTSGPVSRAHLRNALQLVSWIPDREGTFLETLRLFEDADFMGYILSKCKNRAVVAHFEKFKNTSGDHGFNTWLPYLIPRLSPFCSSPITRRMLNRPKSTVSIADAVSQGKILLFNLSTASLGSVESRVFGSLMMNQIFFAAMAAGPIQGTSRPPFHLVVDEAASMISENMLPIWAQARKFGLSLTTANQSIGQMRNRVGASTIAEAMIANTASKLMFRLGSDTERLQPYFRSAFTDTDMVELPVFHAVANIVNHGQPLPPFVVRVKRPVRNDLQHATAQECVEASHRAYAAPMAAVVDELCRTFDLQAADVGVVIPPPRQKPANATPPDSCAIVIEKAVPIGERFFQAMSLAMHSTPGMQYPDDLIPLMNGAYVARDAKELPSLHSAGIAIKQDATLNVLTKARLQLALSDVRSQFWLEESSPISPALSSASTRHSAVF